MLRYLLISAALASVVPALLIPGFVSDNLGGDFSYLELVDGVEIERTDLYAVSLLFISMFLPIFIAVAVLAGVIWAYRRT